MQNFFLRPDSIVPNEIFQILQEKMASSQICKMCVAYLTHGKIAEFLHERYSSGLSTQLLLNAHDLIRPPEGGATNTELRFSPAIKEIFEFIEGQHDENMRIKVLGTRRPQWTVMHHKFVVFDDLVGFGSMNFTKLALSKNYENFSFTDDSSTISNFNDEFDSLWDIASDLWIDNGHLRNLVCPICDREEGVDFESWGLLCTLCGTHFGDA